MKTRVFHSQEGFTLVQSTFILVVLALLGVAMMRLAGVQSATSTMQLQGARAYQAARSGLEWGAARAASGSSCDGTMTIEHFSVTVSCTSESFTEGSIGPYTVYNINATASFGNFGSSDFVSRRAQMKVGFP